MSYPSSPNGLSRLPGGAYYAGPDPWFARWRRRFGFPEEYLVIDVVTAGTLPTHDLVLEIGMCLVDDRRPTYRHSVMLDWTREPSITEDHLRYLIGLSAEAIEVRHGAPTGIRYPFSYEVLRQYGMPPRQTLAECLEFIQLAAKEGLAIVAHNGWDFDRLFLESHARRFVGTDLRLPPERFFDTAMMEKARQADGFPRQQESLGAFWSRVRDLRRRGAYWSLHQHCIPTYHLEWRYGLDLKDAHRADFEAHAAHLLFECFRERST